MKKRAIVYSADSNIDILLQITTSLKSIRTFSKDPIDVYILTDSPRSWMQNLYGSRVLDVSSLVTQYGLRETGVMWKGKSVSPMMLFRLLIPLVKELEGYDQVLYLDADTEIWSADFFDIFDQNETSEIVAVRDSLSIPGTIGRISKLHKYASTDDLKYPSNWKGLITGKLEYANSGVLVFNMQAFGTDYSDRAKYVINRLKTLNPGYPDQDILNIYFNIFVLADKSYNAWRQYTTTVRLRHYVRSLRKKSSVYPNISSERPTIVLDSIHENKDLGVLSGIVDHVYILEDTSHPEYMNILKEWLDGNGVLKYTVIPTRDTGKYADLIKKIPSDIVNPSHMDNWVGHYKATMDALRNDYEKIAVFEDSFSPIYLEQHLPELSMDFDLALCTGAGYFARTDEFKATSSKGYIIGKKCMVELRRLFESLWMPSTPGRKIRYVHHWLNNHVLHKQRTYIRK